MKPRTSRAINVQSLRNPDCKTDIWWRLAGFHPYEAMTSPLFDMLTLEAPERWLALLDDPCVAEWISGYHSNEFLSLQQQIEFSLDCAERIVPLTSNEALARAVIGEIRTIVARMYPGGTNGDWKLIRENPRVIKLCNDLENYDSQSGLRHAVNRAITRLVDVESMCDMPAISLERISEHANWNDYKNVSRIIITERRWQWNRLVTYLHQSVPVEATPS